MPDTQIHPTGDVAAPADYVIPSAAELLLKMVHASFDGTGAAGSFKPCLRIISDAGTVAGEAVADDTVAAGGSADVTWFPRVGAAASASAGVSSAWFYAKREVVQSIPAANTRKIGWAVHETSDTAVFSVTSGTTTNDTVKGLKAGIYVAQMTMVWDSPANYPRAGAIITDFAGALGLSHSPATDSATDTTAAGLTYLLGDVKVLIPTSVPGEISVLAFNQDVAAHNVTACYFSILYLSNSSFAT